MRIMCGYVIVKVNTDAIWENGCWEENALSDEEYKAVLKDYILKEKDKLMKVVENL